MRGVIKHELPKSRRVVIKRQLPNRQARWVTISVRAARKGDAPVVICACAAKRTGRGSTSARELPERAGAGHHLSCGLPERQSRDNISARAASVRELRVNINARAASVRELRVIISASCGCARAAGHHRCDLLKGRCGSTSVRELPERQERVIICALVKWAGGLSWSVRELSAVRELSKGRGRRQYKSQDIALIFSPRRLHVA
jgi:hypothetical protein